MDTGGDEHSRPVRLRRKRFALLTQGAACLALVAVSVAADPDLLGSPWILALGAAGFFCAYLSIRGRHLTLFRHQITLLRPGETIEDRYEKTAAPRSDGLSESA